MKCPEKLRGKHCRAHHILDSDHGMIIGLMVTPDERETFICVSASGGESEKDAQTDEETWPALPYSQSNPLSQDKGYDENIQLRA